MRFRTLALAFTLLSGSGRAQDVNRLSGPARPQAPRQQLERQLRTELWRIAKQRIGFSEEQMTKLESSSQRFSERRRVLALDERAQRQTLRVEILADDKADESRLTTALGRILEIQKQRVGLLAQEQEEFATFMTPIQRAKYLALQEELRRRIEALRRARQDSASAAIRP